MVITFPPLPPDFPLMQHYSFLETYTPLFIWEQWVKTDTSSDISINVYSSLVTHPTEAYSGFLSMKWLRVLLFLPGWNASLLKGYLPVSNQASLMTG